MKKALLAVGILGAAFAAFAASTITYDMNGSGGWNDETRWVGGKVPVSGDTVAIPAGTADVNDADAALYKTVKVNLTSGESVLKINTDKVTQPCPGWRYLTGTGTVVKASMGKWTLSQNCGTFTGDFDIQAGIVLVTTETYRQQLGSLSTGRIFIRNGAMIDCSDFSNPDDWSFGSKEVHLAGQYAATTGAVNQTGFEKNFTNLFHYVYLDADTTITLYGGTTSFVGLSPDRPGVLDFCGHDLTILSTKKNALENRVFNVVFRDVLVTNSVPGQGGHLRYANSNGTHTLKIGDNVIFDAAVTFHLEKYAKIAFEGSTTELGASLETTADVTLVGSTTAEAGPFVYSGSISGGAGVSVNKESRGIALTGDNDFSGMVSVDGSGVTRASLTAAAPDSIPSADKITVKASTLALQMKNFTLAKYFEYVNGVTYQNAVSGDLHYVTSVTIDPEGCPDDTYSYSIASGDITNPQAAVGVAGNGTVGITGFPKDDYVSLAAWKGTLKVSGNDTIRLGEALVTSFPGEAPGELVIENAKDVDVSSNACWIGYTCGETSVPYGKVTIRNSNLRCHAGTAMRSYEGFMVGAYGAGRLVVENSYVTNRLHIGHWMNGNGEFILKGGHYCTWGSPGSTDNKSVFRMGLGGHGYLQIDDGEFYVRPAAQAAFDRDGSAVIAQNGGIFTVGKTEDTGSSQFYLGTHTGYNKGRTVAQYWMRGGTGYTRHRTYVAGLGSGSNSAYKEVDKNSYGVMTVEGEGTTFRASEYFGVGCGYDATGIVNVNDGGTIRAKNFYGSTGGRNGKSYVNFNGGIYEHAGYGGLYLFGDGPDAAEDDGGITRVTVYAKGATIILASSQGDPSSGNYAPRRFGQPIHNASGKGVGQIPWTETERVFRGAPVVIIEGDGFGATAMANYDYGTGKISGFTVTSPGCDYETATAYLVQGVNTNAVIDLSGSLVENNPNGSVTFRHTNTGRLTFDLANDYVGETTLESVYSTGQFNITNKDAFAKSKAIKLKSGVLYLANYTLDDLTAPFKFMGGTVKGDAASYVIPEGRMVIDLKDVVAGEQYTVANNANLVLPSSIPLLNGDSVALDENVKYMILTLPKNYSGTLPAFTGVPENWHVSRTATGFRLSHDRGMMLIVK